MTLFLTFTMGILIYLVLWNVFFNREHFLKPFRYRTTLSRREKKKFEHEFQLFLIDLVRLIQAGIPLAEALKIAATDNGALIEEAILMPLQRIDYGEKPDEAWAKATAHFNSPSFDQFVMVIQLQQEIGGKIAEMLERLSQIIRAKEQLSEKIKALTAEGQLSALIIGILPPGLLAALYFLSPLYINEFLAHKAAVPLLSLAILFWCAGIFSLVKLNRGMHG